MGLAKKGGKGMNKGGAVYTTVVWSKWILGVVCKERGSYVRGKVEKKE